MNVTVAGYIMAALFGLSGALCLACAIVNSDWFFRSQGVKMLTWRLSRLWQRILYALLGCVMLAMACYIVVSVA